MRDLTAYGAAEKVVDDHGITIDLFSLNLIVNAVLDAVREGAESLYPLDRSTQDRVRWAIERAEGIR